MLINNASDFEPLNTYKMLSFQKVLIHISTKPSISIDVSTHFRQNHQYFHSLSSIKNWSQINKVSLKLIVNKIRVNYQTSLDDLLKNLIR